MTTSAELFAQADALQRERDALAAKDQQIRELLAESLRIQEEIYRRLAGNRLSRYNPYPKQLDFHGAGAIYRERLLVAGNQLGKTWSAAFETAMHLTGRYPDDWKGRRFAHPTKGWGCGETAEVVRDSMQLLLLGKLEDIGTGAIPRECIVSTTKKRGVTDALDTITIRHASGGLSKLTFKAYEQGREKFQAATLDFVWLDEEPDEDIYQEALTRTNATGGIVYMTFTPLKGMTATVKRFLLEQNPDRIAITMTIYDALHYTPEQRERIIASYPAHTRKARAMGIPTLGSGLIFPIERELIEVKAFPIPDHWARLGGLDFGWDHPSGAVEMCIDRDTDVVYVTKAHRQREQTPLLFAATIKPWGDWLPWAWPADGLQHSKDSGRPLRDQYEAQGLNMMEKHATHPPEPGKEEGTGGNGVEAGLLEMLDRMQTGRFKVFSHLEDWFSEFAMYHREDGKIVKLDDDLLSATRYAYMMRRHAATRPAPMKPWAYKNRMVT